MYKIINGDVREKIKELKKESVGRNGIGIELNEEYIEIAKERLNTINKVKPKRKLKKKENTQSLKIIQHKLFE